MINDFFNISFTTLNLMSSMVTAGASLLMYRPAKIQIADAKNKSTREYAPYLFPENAWFRKQSWIRFYDGVDVPSYIPSKKYENLTTDEKKYFDNCKKYENAQKVYFEQLENKIILVANINNKMPTTIIEHGSAEIQLINYGEATVTKLTVNHIEIYMLNGKVYKLGGGTNNFYTNVIPKGGSINIWLDEVTNDINTSTCKISKEKYDQLDDAEIFSNSIEALQYYNTIIVDITLENIYCEKFNYKIIVEKKDNHLQKHVELVHTNRIIL